MTPERPLTASQLARIALASYLRSRGTRHEKVSVLAAWRAVERTGLPTTERIRKDATRLWYLADCPAWRHEGRSFIRVAAPAQVAQVAPPPPPPPPQSPEPPPPPPTVPMGVPPGEVSQLGRRVLSDGTVLTHS